MDERLPLGSLDAPTLRMLLEKERNRHEEFAQEILRLQAGLARQNERILALERENAGLRQWGAEQRHLSGGLTAQNDLLRQQIAVLEADHVRLQGMERVPKREPGAWPSERTKRDEEKQPRKKRDRSQNRGRQRMAQADEEVIHAAEACPRCGMPLAGGWEHRRIQVIEAPDPAPVRVIEHVLLRRHCPRCRTRVLPSSPGHAAGRIGRCRFGPRLLSQIVTMAIVERLPIRQIQRRLASQYALPLSVGGIIGVLQQAARQSTPLYTSLQADVRASPVVHADETGWREDGIPGYIWTLVTDQSCIFHRDAHRSGAVIDALLGESFGGTLVTDFYAAYDHLPGVKQRCWAHLWRDIDALETEYPEEVELAAWVAGVRAIYDLARGDRPAAEMGNTPHAMRAREERARGYEQQLLHLCPETIPPEWPHATLAKRIRRYLQELFTFVADPRVPHTNNAAERGLRPLVIARKVSGGTRSEEGSSTRMILASIAATARVRNLDPAVLFLQIFSDPSHTF